MLRAEIQHLLRLGNAANKTTRKIAPLENQRKHLDRQRMLRRALAWKRVVIATDADAPGEAAAVELRAALTIGTRCLRLPFPAGTKDVNEWLQRDRDGLRAALAALSPADAAPEDEPEDLAGYARTVLL